VGNASLALSTCPQPDTGLVDGLTDKLAGGRGRSARLLRPLWWR